MTPERFARRPIRRRLEAVGLAALAPVMHRGFGDVKQAALGSLRGTIVEIGPGTGANMRYYRPGVAVVAYEPNPAMYARLRQAAAEAEVELTIRETGAEHLAEADATVDAVVSTLVLCGVDEVSTVLAEVRRVLKPGGKFVFIEHVVAPAGSWTRRWQRAAKRPHRWLMNGCEVDRDTATAIESAGFSSVEMTTVDEGGLGYVRPIILGTAWAE